MFNPFHDLNPELATGNGKDSNDVPTSCGSLKLTGLKVVVSDYTNFEKTNRSAIALTVADLLLEDTRTKTGNLYRQALRATNPG